MEKLGIRIATIRAEIGITQSALGRLAGIAQPRLSRIERGDASASVAAVNSIAAALGRVGLDLALGTERESYYIANGLSPEQAAVAEKGREFARIFDGIALHEYYRRVYALFAAVYAGPYIALRFNAEPRYLDLLARCQRIIDKGAIPVPNLHFPDHLDVIDDDDVNSWEFVEPEMRRSLLELERLEFVLTPTLEQRSIADVILHETVKIGIVDDEIKELTAIRVRENQLWLERIQRSMRRAQSEPVHDSSKTQFENGEGDS